MVSLVQYVQAPSAYPMAAAPAPAPGEYMNITFNMMAWSMVNTTSGYAFDVVLHSLGGMGCEQAGLPLCAVW